MHVETRPGDTPEKLAERILHALEAVDTVIYMDVPTVRNLADMLRVLLERGGRKVA